MSDFDLQNVLISFYIYSKTMNSVTKKDLLKCKTETYLLISDDLNMLFPFSSFLWNKVF